MVINEVEQGVVHRLPIAIRAVHPEVGRCVRQPTGAGTLPLDWIKAEKAVHLMLVVYSRAPMCPAVGHRARVASVILMLLRWFFLVCSVLMAAVILVFLSGSVLFRAHCATVLMGLMVLVLLLLALFEFLQDVLRFAGSWAEIAKRKRTHGEHATQKAMHTH